MRRWMGLCHIRSKRHAEKKKLAHAHGARMVRQTEPVRDGELRGLFLARETCISLDILMISEGAQELVPRVGFLRYDHLR